MNAVSVADAKLNLEKLLESVVANVEPLIIVGDRGDQTVVVSLDEFNSWQETMYLLASPANADRLRRSINQMHEGKVVYQELADL